MVSVIKFPYWLEINTCKSSFKYTDAKIYNSNIIDLHVSRGEESYDK